MTSIERLVSWVVPLAQTLDPLDVAGTDGFVWRSAAGTLLGTGVAARVPVGTGPARIERAAEAVTTLLESIQLEDPDDSGLTPAAVGALPFHPATPGELVVPSLLLRTDEAGHSWAIVTGPEPSGRPRPADLLARLRARASDDGPWPAARRIDDGGSSHGEPSEGAPSGEGPSDGGPSGEGPSDGGLWTTRPALRRDGLPSRSGAPPAGKGWGSGTPTAGSGGGGSGGGGPGGGPEGGGSGTGNGGSGSSPSGLETWRAGVVAALAAIGAGRLDKVVLAREATVEADWPFPRAELLRRLQRRPGGATFLYADGGFVGASPELLVRRQGRVATSRPMAGTVPQGDGAAEAGGLARLTGSPKEAVEHRLVVDAVAEGLAKVADRVEVGKPEVVRLATVAHLATEITADLTGPLPTALELAGLLHPTPAVGGSPRDGALAAIAALEPFDRGCYAGPVGWVDRSGDGEWAVALRGATLKGRRAHLVAGAGIVPGSDPDAEWAETEHKLRAMLEVLLTP